jgi:hypothetical protein
LASFEGEALPGAKAAQKVLFLQGHFVNASRSNANFSILNSWYDSIPEVLRLGQNFTPYVLFAQ